MWGRIAENFLLGCQYCTLSRHKTKVEMSLRKTRYYNPPSNTHKWRISSARGPDRQIGWWIENQRAVYGTVPSPSLQCEQVYPRLGSMWLWCYCPPLTCLQCSIIIWLFVYHWGFRLSAGCWVLFFSAGALDHRVFLSFSVKIAVTQSQHVLMLQEWCHTCCFQLMWIGNTSMEG